MGVPLLLLGAENLSLEGYDETDMNEAADTPFFANIFLYRFKETPLSIRIFCNGCQGSVFCVLDIRTEEKGYNELG